jgi:hypothetical protein
MANKRVCQLATVQSGPNTQEKSRARTGAHEELPTGDVSTKLPPWAIWLLAEHEKLSRKKTDNPSASVQADASIAQTVPESEYNEVKKLQKPNRLEEMEG